MIRDSILITKPAYCDVETETEQDAKDNKLSISKTFVSPEDLNSSGISKSSTNSTIDSSVQLNDIYAKLDERDKILKNQINKIKKSIQKLSNELEVTKNPKLEAAYNRSKAKENMKKDQNTKKRATERLKFITTQERPNSMIDKLEALTNQEIDLYFRPVRPVSEPIIVRNMKKTLYKKDVVTIEYPDGTLRIKRDFCENIRFNTGDIEQRFKNGLVVHQYYSNGAIDAILPSGTKYIVFTNGQVEQHDPSGVKTVYFGDGKYMRIDEKGKSTIKYEENLPKGWPRLSIK